MHEVLIGQSYYLRFDPKLWEAMQPYPPLGSLYAASYLQSKGYQVAFFDAMLAESERQWEIALEKERPRFAVLFEDNFNYLSKMCLLRMRQAAFTMIAMAKEKGCSVIVCGADASDHAPEYLAQGADYVLIGEGEITLGELLDHLTGRAITETESILGLTYCFPDDRTKVMQNPRRPDIHDLDALPFPAWNLVDIDRYASIWKKRHGYFSMNMVTTRGCPFHCNWCAKPIWGQRYNSRSPENVIAELKWLKATYHPEHIWFVDDIFGLKPKWLTSFAQLVNESKTRIPFKCLSRADLLLRPGEIDALKTAGCQIVWMGAESGSQKILDLMEKGTTIAQIYTSTQRLQTAGIKVGFFLQFGYPGETIEDIELTLKMVRECQPDDIGMSVSYPLPGTPFYERVQTQLGSKRNWIESSDLAMLYRGPFTTTYYRQLHRVLHKEFRLMKVHQKKVFLKKNSNGFGKLNMGGFRSFARQVFDTLTIPADRWQLNRLAKSSTTGVEPLEPVLSRQESALPTYQNQDG